MAGRAATRTKADTSSAKPDKHEDRNASRWERRREHASECRQVASVVKTSAQVASGGDAHRGRAFEG